jgi:3-hydroxyisobutyrate dehydrogenase
VTRTVTVLGTGIMGAGMARNLARAGLEVTVWNRNPEKARPLAEVGARLADDPASAVEGADVIVTMLFDAEAVEHVMGQALASARPDSVWAQSSTVGLDGVARMAQLAERHSVGFIDAPVLGTRQPAEDGTLLVLAGGPQRWRSAVTPVFDAIGSRTVWVGDRPGDGHRLKLVANSWVLSVVAGTAQAVALADDLGLDPQRFFDTIAGGPLDCAYAQLKGRAMVADEFPTSFPLAGAAKDSALIKEAMRGAGTDHTIMDALHDRFVAAVEARQSDEDMAAVVHAIRATHTSKRQ